MPPVSVTMHPRNLLVVEALLVLDPVDEATGELDVLVLVLGLGLDEALDELLPQAASSKHVLAAAAAAYNAVCLTVSSSKSGLPEIGTTELSPPHRLPGDYFVSVSGGRGRTGLRPPRCRIATQRCRDRDERLQIGRATWMKFCCFQQKRTSTVPQVARVPNLEHFG
jgi:hypothetical protein